jgi:hypothetical protein
MSDFKRQLPTRDELCSDIESYEEKIMEGSVRFIGARETRRKKINALRTEIEQVNHFHMLIIVI